VKGWISAGKWISSLSFASKVTKKKLLPNYTFLSVKLVSSLKCRSFKMRKPGESRASSKGDEMKKKIVWLMPILYYTIHLNILWFTTNDPELGR